MPTMQSRSIPIIILMLLAFCAGRGGSLPAIAAGIEVLAPADGKELPGDSFELAWRCNPNEIGTAVAIMLNNTIIANYYQNAAENHITVKVPMAYAQTRYNLRVASYWRMRYENGFYYPVYEGSVNVKFTDSINVLEPSVLSGQAGTTLTVTWRGHPEYTGTALRLELWHNGDLMQVLGYVWDYTTVEGQWSGPMPHVERDNYYSVRMVSLYREMQGGPNDPKEAYSKGFSLNGLPYVQVLSPTTATRWVNWGGPYHVLWVADPAYFGTAARVELWLNGRFYMLLGHKYDCGEENDLEIACPPAISSESIGGLQYKVRVVSLWQEAHPHYGIPAYDDGEAFNIDAVPLGRLLWPTPGKVWEREDNGKFRIDYKSSPTLMGTAVRFDLWQGNAFFKTVGYNWDNQADNSVYVDDPRVSADSQFYLRVVSLWQESHPTPSVPAFTEILQSVVIGSSAPFRFLFATAYNEGAMKWLQLGWHAEWPFVGTTFRVEMWPMHPQMFNEHYVVADPQSYGDDSYRSFMLPPLSATETLYYVRMASYWQESIQGPYQSIQTKGLVQVPQ